MFQHTAARRRLGLFFFDTLNKCIVSTHSRPKAAGKTLSCFRPVFYCFNTQPPEGGWLFDKIFSTILIVSTHSRPKAAGSQQAVRWIKMLVSTHSRPKAAGIPTL